MANTTTPASVGEDGINGISGPNDNGYINDLIRRAAKDLVRASAHWCVGYGYKCVRMPAEHPIALALSNLAEMDRRTAQYANCPPDPNLFKPFNVTDKMIDEFHAFQSTT